VVDALLATGPCLADPATPTGCALWLCGLKSPVSRLRPPFYGDVTFFYTVTAPPRSAPPRAAPPCAAPPAPSLRSAACTALPLPRRLCRDASRRDACAATPHAATPARGAASRGSAPQPPRRLAREAVSPPRAAL
jgi:hypothetical protein